MSDSSQGAGWWQAADGKWYPPDQPPAPGWWRASDGNWYPPQDESPAAEATSAEPPSPAPTSPAPTPSPVEPAPLGAPVTPAGPPPAAPPPTGPLPGGGASRAGGSGGKTGLIAVVAVVVVLALIGAGVLVARRGGSDTATTSSAGQTGAGNTGTTPSGGDSGIAVGGDAGTDELPSKDITLADDVVVVKSNGGKAVKKIGEDGTTIVLDPAAEGADKLEAGKVLLLTGVTVVKVADVNTTSAGLEVTAEPATLPDVIKDGTLDWSDMVVDPGKGQLLSLPGDGEATDDSGTASDGGTTDDTTDEMTEEMTEDINGVLGGGFRGPRAGVHAAPGIHDKTVSGAAGGWGFSIDYNPEGGGHHLVLSLKPKSEMQGEIKADITLKPMNTSGHIVMVDSTTKEFEFSTAEYGGTADISVQLTALQNIASINLPPFFKLPFSLEFPAIVGGVPFMLKFAGTVQINMSLTATGNSLSAQAKITYDGDAGMVLNGKALELSGKRVQDAPDLLSKVVGSGQVGVNFVTELPKVTFGFGFQLANAGVFISNGMVAETHVLPAPAMCTALNIAYVLAGGVEASFLTKDFEIARKAFVDKRWNYQAPNDGRCNKEK